MSGGNFLDWTACEPQAVAPDVGVLARRGAVVEVARITLAPGAVLKEHAHAEEQFFFMLSGRLRYRVGDEERSVGSGELIYMPGGVPHAGRVEGAEPAVFIEVKELKRAPAVPA